MKEDRKMVTEQLRQQLELILEHNPFSKLIGLEILEIDDGYARGRVKLEDRLKNVHGGMHGGCPYAMADTLAGVAASTYGYYTTTIDGSMNYLRPMINTEYVYCEARVVRQGGTVGVYQTELTNDQKEVLAIGTFSYYKTTTPLAE